MKHLRKFNEENIFNRIFNSSNEKMISNICKDLGLNYSKTEPMPSSRGTEVESFQIGPKNGHEIRVTFREYTTGDSDGDMVRRKYQDDKLVMFVRPSYYGSYNGDEIEVRDLKQYLSDYDFNSKPNVTHKYSISDQNEDVKILNHLRRFNENLSNDELITESIIGKLFDRLGYTNEVLKTSIKQTLGVDDDASKSEIIEKTKELFGGSDSKRKLLRVARALGVLGELVTALVISFNVPWNNWTWLGTFIYLLLSHSENNIIRKPWKDIVKNDEFFKDDDKKVNESRVNKNI